MNLTHYYSKIRQLEESFGREFVLVVSEDTSDGGKKGVVSEVPKRLAAKMIVDKTARLAAPEEEQAYWDAEKAARMKLEEEAARNKLQFTVVSAADLDSLRESTRKKKQK